MTTVLEILQKQLLVLAIQAETQHVTMAISMAMKRSLLRIRTIRLMQCLKYRRRAKLLRAMYHCVRIFPSNPSSMSRWLTYHRYRYSCLNTIVTYGNLMCVKKLLAEYVIINAFQVPPAVDVDDAVSKSKHTPRSTPQVHEPPRNVHPSANNSSIASGFSGDMMSDCIDKNLTRMGGDNLKEAMSAAKELIYLFRDQTNYASYLITKADVIAKTIGVQFSMIRNTYLATNASDEETVNLLRSICNLAIYVSWHFFLCAHDVVVSVHLPASCH